MNPRVRMLAVAATVIFVLATSAAAFGLADDDDADRAGGRAKRRTSPSPVTTTPTSTAPTTAVSTPPTTAVPPELRALVEELQRFVAGRRGLPFKEPVRVALLDPAAFRARLLGGEQAGEDDDEKADVAAFEGLLRTLGLVEGGDLGATLRDFVADGTDGFYDARTNELVVRGTDQSPYVRAVFVHELTHALQDQHFNLDRTELYDRDDDAALGFEALVEGDASRVEDAYVESLSIPDRTALALEAQRRHRDGAGSKPPGVLQTLLGFPYEYGQPFVDALHAQGGRARVDAAFAAPPTTSEQVLHPDRFLRGDNPKPVDAPPADGAVVDSGVLGELGLALLLANGASDSSAALGWGGDRYVTWGSGARTCVRARIVMDTRADAAELRNALVTWTRYHGKASVSGSSVLTLTACGPPARRLPANPPPPPAAAAPPSEDRHPQFPTPMPAGESASEYKPDPTTTTTTTPGVRIQIG